MNQVPDYYGEGIVTSLEKCGYAGEFKTFTEVKREAENQQEVREHRNDFKLINMECLARCLCGM